MAWKNIARASVALWNQLAPWMCQLTRWFLVLSLTVALAACNPSQSRAEPSPLLASPLLSALPKLPRISAERRLFLDLSLDFLGEYDLPKMKFADTPVGGLSGITYDRQRDRFYAISDDRSDFAPARFYTLKLNLDKTNSKAPKIQTVEVEGVTILKDETGQPFAKGTIDLEGIALSPLRSLFISSEGVARDGIPPFVREFDLATGQQRRSLPMPARYLPTKDDTGKQISGVQDNLGFEALTINPGGYGNVGLEPFRLFTIPESALIQDKPTEPTQEIPLRMLHYLVEQNRSLLISEHLYSMEPTPAGTIAGLAELLAIDQGGHFLSLERSFNPLTGIRAKIYQLATGGASDTTTVPSLQGSLKGTVPIRKQLLLDLNQLGVFLDNLEGMALGPHLPDGSQSLLLVSDDNFRKEQRNQFLLFRLKGVR